jgi:hypothetical protein
MKTNNSIVKLMLVASVGFIFSFSAIADGAQKSQEILDAYLKVKDALVKTDPKLASESAKTLVSVIGESTDELLSKIIASAKKIKSSGDVKEQRTFFNDLSENVYLLLKGTSDIEAPVYRQYCPMAFSNTGAYWLAAEKEINNPYFGSMMLHCGSVKEEL